MNNVEITSDASEVHNVDVCNGLSEKDSGHKHSGSQMNGNHDAETKLSYESDESSDKHSKLSRICSSSRALTQTPSTMSTKLETPRNEITDESNKNKKFCVTRISKTKSISVDFRLSRGIAEVCHNAFFECGF